jgi:hypothetical protein
MTPWISLSTDDVYACLAALQADILRSRLLATGETDPLAALLTEVTARVRAEVRTGRRCRLDQDQTLVPPELKLAACHLAVEALQARIPNLALTEDQTRLANEARQLLARVAGGELAVCLPVNPEGPLQATVWYGLEVLRRRRHTVSGRSLRGL